MRRVKLKILISGSEKQENSSGAEICPGDIKLLRVLFVNVRRKEVNERR